MACWTKAFIATDLMNPDTGEPLYVWVKVRPRWYWVLCRLRLFALIVRRDFHGVRIGWRTAWAVSRVAMGLTPKRMQP